MKTKKKTKTTKYTPPVYTPEQIAEQEKRAEAYYAAEREFIAKLDVHCAPAHGVKPLFRMRLARIECTSLGYHLLDVVAVIKGEPERGSKHVFPTYICLGLCERGWMTVELSGYDGATEMEEAYEVVS